MQHSKYLKAHGTFFERVERRCHPLVAIILLTFFYFLLKVDVIDRCNFTDDVTYAQQKVYSLRLYVW